MPITPRAAANVIVKANRNLPRIIWLRDNGSSPSSQSCWLSSETIGNTKRLVNVARIRQTAVRFRKAISTCRLGWLRSVHNRWTLAT